MLTVDFDRLAIPSGGTLLDLGCGAGRHSYAALRRGTNVVAVDLDGRLLQDVSTIAAAMAAQGETNPDVSFVALEGDGTALPFASHSFDAVIVSEVLEHVWDDRRALDEIHRVVAPGGTVAVTVPRFWPERVCWALSTRYHSNPGGHVRIYRRAALVDKLACSGFDVVGSHHAHALHAPYWWLKCLVGPDNERFPLVKAYRRFLEWDITATPRTLRGLEKALDPVLGKSLVVYATKPVGEVSLAA